MAEILSIRQKTVYMQSIKQVKIGILLVQTANQCVSTISNVKK